jgi:hypothetical protein
VNPEVAAGLRALAEALPPDAAVPVPRAWLLELLAGMKTDRSGPLPADLTVAELAVRFGRKASTVRGWLDRGLIAGAYRFRGREWRVPAASLVMFEAEQRFGQQARAPSAGTSRKSKPVDLGAWRHAS